MMNQVMPVQKQEKKDWKDYALAGVQALSAASSIYQNIAGAGAKPEPKAAIVAENSSITRRLGKYGYQIPE